LQKFATRFKVAPQCGQVLVVDSDCGGGAGGEGLCVGSGRGEGSGLYGGSSFGGGGAGRYGGSGCGGAGL